MMTFGAIQETLKKSRGGEHDYSLSVGVWGHVGAQSIAMLYPRGSQRENDYSLPVRFWGYGGSQSMAMVLS